MGEVRDFEWVGGRFRELEWFFWYCKSTGSGGR